MEGIKVCTNGRKENWNHLISLVVTIIQVQRLKEWELLQKDEREYVLSFPNRKIKMKSSLSTWS
jgi:hypothetical protein